MSFFRVRRPRRGLRSASALGIAFATALASLQIAAAQGVTPPTVTSSLNPGASMTVPKTVLTPAFPPNPDLVFLADTTASMGPAIANVETNATSIMNTVLAAQPTSQFGVAQYRDVGDTPLFSLDQAITGNTAAVQTAIIGWAVGGGGDTPECQLYALQQLATGATGFRAGSTRVIAWFGDASGHDPCNGVSLAAATSALVSANIRVIAINVVTASGDGLNATGQAASIATATGGVFLNNVAAGDVSAAILAGLSNLPVTVTHTLVACNANLTVSLTPASQTGTSPLTAAFVETITVAAGAPQGSTLTCTVNFLVNGSLMTGFTESISIRVNDVTAPVASCLQGLNPTGTVIPAAGNNPNSGQNPDGFYKVGATDNVDPTSQVFVKDMGSGTVFGPFPSTTNIKYTQAPGATPGSRVGPGGVVFITGTGDAVVYSVDAGGNPSALVSCKVPPPPR
jgi:hypothetical protein